MNSWTRTMKQAEEAVFTLQPGTWVEALPSGNDANGVPITRKITMTIDRKPWFGPDRLTVILSDGRSVTAVEPASIRVLTNADKDTVTFTVPMYAYLYDDNSHTGWYWRCTGHPPVGNLTPSAYALVVVDARDHNDQHHNGAPIGEPPSTGYQHA